MFIRKSEKKGLSHWAFLPWHYSSATNHSQEWMPDFLDSLFPTFWYDTTITLKHLVIELNSADSTTLIGVRGIGPYYAKKILRYREQLGGFHSTRQLGEIKFQYLNIDSLLPCFSVNPALIRKKELDTMSFKSVLHHPYLEYEDVQLIFNAKRKFGKINYSILESQKVLPPFKLKK